MTEFEFFFVDLCKELEKFLLSQQTPQTRRRMNEVIDEIFLQVQVDQRLFEIEQGMRVVGGRAHANKHDANAVCIVWETTFHPHARWRGQAGQIQPLGFHLHYDLYIGYQSGLSPTLIMRYGNAPEDYVSYNPGLLGREAFYSTMSDNPSLLAATEKALARADFVTGNIADLPYEAR